MLGALDGERPGQAAAERPAVRQEADPRDVSVPDERESARSLPSVPFGIRGEVPQGNGLSAQGRRRPVHVLRFSGRTLDAHPDDEPNRIGVRHGAAPDAADEGLRVSVGDVDDGLQARDAG